MQSVLAAETAVFVELETIRVVLLVLHRVVVALFAFAACKSDLDSHFFRHLLIDLGFALRPRGPFSYLPQPRLAAQRILRSRREQNSAKKEPSL